MSWLFHDALEGIKMHILVINFTAETTPEQFDDLIKEDAPVFAAIEGLIHKNFIFNHEEKTYGGVYPMDLVELKIYSHLQEKERGSLVLNEVLSKHLNLERCLDKLAH